MHDDERCAQIGRDDGNQLYVGNIQDPSRNSSGVLVSNQSKEGVVIAARRRTIAGQGGAIVFDSRDVQKNIGIGERIAGSNEQCRAALSRKSCYREAVEG